MIRRPVVRAVVAIAMVAAMPSAHAEACPAGVDLLYCVEGSSVPAIECDVTEVEYTCQISAVASGIASTASSAPGDLVVDVSLEVGICSQPGPCEQTWYQPAGGCTWDLDGGGCAAEVVFERIEAGQAGECVYAWVYQRVVAGARAPGMPVNLRSDADTEIADYTNCPYEDGATTAG